MKFLTVLLIALLCLAGVGSVYGIVITSPNPTNESTVYTNVINYSASFTNVTNVTECNISIGIDGTWVNYTATVCTNSTVSYFIDGQDTNSGNPIYYKWLVDNGSTLNTDDESGIYYYQIGMFYAVVMTIEGVTGMIGSFLNAMVWVAVIILIIAIVGWFKGWFGKKGLGGILDFNKIKS